MAKTGTGAPTISAPPLSEVEREVQDLLDSDANGDIDNVFDIVEELLDLEERLPENSRLRPAWNNFHADCMKIMTGDDAE